MADETPAAEIKPVEEQPKTSATDGTTEKNTSDVEGMEPKDEVEKTEEGEPKEETKEEKSDAKEEKSDAKEERKSDENKDEELVNFLSLSSRPYYLTCSRCLFHGLPYLLFHSHHTSRPVPSTLDLTGVI